MINIYQIQIDGRSAGKHSIARELMCGGFDKWQDSFAKHYDLVASIDVDTLNEAFEIGNIGPNEQILRVVGKRMHSPSVGDVFVNTMTGQASFVNRIGFVFLAPGLFPEFVG